MILDTVDSGLYICCQSGNFLASIRHCSYVPLNFASFLVARETVIKHIDSYFYSRCTGYQSEQPICRQSYAPAENQILLLTFVYISLSAAHMADVSRILSFTSDCITTTIVSIGISSSIGWDAHPTIQRESKPALSSYLSDDALLHDFGIIVPGLITNMYFSSPTLPGTNGGPANSVSAAGVLYITSSQR